nr:Ig-like domain-containing protein [bacterium]
MSTDRSGSGVQKNKEFGPDRLLLVIVLVSVCMIAGLAIYNQAGKKPQKQEEIVPDRIPVKVISFVPSGEVKRTKNISVEFSNNMVGEDEVGRKLHQPPVDIQPPIPAEYRWTERHKLGIFPVKNFEKATEYVVRVPPGICGNVNMYLTGDTEFRFNTEPLKVSRSSTSYVYEKEEKITTRVEWKIEFNYPVSPDELAGGVRIYYDFKEGPRDIPFTISPVDEKSKIFVIRTDRIDRSRVEGRQKNIRFLVQKGLKSMAGPLTLPHDRMDSLNVETDLKVYGLTSRQKGKKIFLQLDLSAVVAARDIEKYISLTPELDYYIEQDDRYVKIIADFDPGAEYTVGLARGLEAVDTTTLKDDYSGRVRIPDLEPALSFKYKGIFLPSKGNKKLAIESVNINRVTVNIEKQFINNLVFIMKDGTRHYDYYDYYGGDSSYGRNVYSEEIKVKSEKNRVGTTVLDMEEFWNTKRKGIFLVTASYSGERWINDSSLVLLTDLGIIAEESEDGLLVWVNTLKGMKPVAGAEVKLFSGNNQVIASAVTGRDGVAVIRGLHNRIAEEKFAPYIITAEYKDDTSFLLMKDCRMPLTAFDTGGRKHLASGYEAFVYTDRGIYRPGD